MNPQDALALQIGRAIVQLAIAQQRIQNLEERNAELEALVAAYEARPQEQAA